MSDWWLKKKNRSSTLLTSSSTLKSHQLIKLLEDVIPVGRKLLKSIPVKLKLFLNRITEQNLL